MRISTNQIYDSGTLGIQKGQSSLYKLQNQLSSGRRVLTPQDDPVAASEELMVSQSKGVNDQYMDAQGQAKHQLSMIDSTLSSTVQQIQSVRDLVIQGRNTYLTLPDREALSKEVEARFGQLLDFANNDNGTGEYLFSGYRGKVQPFALDSSKPTVSPATTPPVSYFGDEGERLLQVAFSRQIPVSLSGHDVFMNIKNGNGNFVAATGGNQILNAPPPTPPSFTANGINKGTASINEGAVLDYGLWSSPSNPANFRVRFSVDNTTGVPVTTYQLYDNRDPLNPVALLAQEAPYTPGQVIPIENTTLIPSVSYGANIVIDGVPSDGDSFTLVPSTSQNLFKTIQNIVGILKAPIGTETYTGAEYINQLGLELANLDQALDNIGRVQADVGTHMQEVETLKGNSQDLDIRYQSRLSDLHDLDYAKAISDFMQSQMSLDAAQKSFSQVTNLSLFKYI